MTHRRYVIVGNSGAGKSTLGRELAAATGLPLIHLDRLFWKPGWVETPRDEWRALQARALSGQAWIAEGNYGGTMDLRCARAECIVFLDYPRRVCLAGVIRRRLRRRRGRPDLAEGCRERLELSFLRYVWDYDRLHRPRTLAKIAEFGAHAEVVRLRSRAETRDWLRQLEVRRAD